MMLCQLIGLSEGNARFSCALPGEQGPQLAPPLVLMERRGRRPANQAHRLSFVHGSGRVKRSFSIARSAA